MPKITKYSFIDKNNLSNKIIEKADTSITTTFSPTPSCPVGSFFGPPDESPQPLQKPCQCINNTNKWIPIDGAC
jgi:hypothetical protein